MSQYEEIPSAEDRSFVIAAAMDKLREYPDSANVVASHGHGDSVLMRVTPSLEEAIRLAGEIEARTGCWTCVCGKNGVVWQAFVAVVPRHAAIEAAGQLKLIGEEE